MSDKRDSFHILVIPDVGSIDIRKYKEEGEFLYELWDLLRLRDKGMFAGDILPFRGTIYEYSEAVPTYRVTKGDGTQVEMIDKSRFDRLKLPEPGVEIEEEKKDEG